jgi:hypothetical protein
VAEREVVDVSKSIPYKIRPLNGAKARMYKPHLLIVNVTDITVFGYDNVKDKSISKLLKSIKNSYHDL